MSAMLRLFVLLAAPLLVAATIPLTVVVPPNDKMCFYVQSHTENAQIGLSFFVLSGGNFDIDAVIRRPDMTVVQEIRRSTNDEVAFKSTVKGEYQLCFHNEFSTFAEKKVEFDFDIETKYLTAELPHMVGEGNTEVVDRYVSSLEKRVTTLTRELAFYKVRNVRNESTVRSTSSRIFWFCIVDLLIIVLLAIANVTTVQYFFKGSRKNLV